MKIQRKFILGDQWIYYKIYLGEFTSDLILVDLIKSLVEHLLEAGIIDKFFFIRYNEGGHHLRVRFHLAGKEKIIHLITLFNEAFKESMEKNFVSKIQADTYDRELERYFDECIIFSENIFYHDSIAILDFLALMRKKNLDENYRWLYGIYMIDFLIKDFGFNMNERLKIIESLNESFSREFSLDKRLKDQLDAKFRAEREKIKRMLNGENGDFQSRLKLKSRHISSDIADLKLRLGRDEQIKILASYIHMSCNRLFRGSQRKHEFVLYHFLWKHYRSEVGRANHHSKSPKSNESLL
ncbi:thiopeptide-type bacteriocin biosynthesis protein [Flavobacterium ginsenosidimutans]|uniref:thiopeptide-type bacteriocin biosynthesis protein n=1 Tax=Flavobacterium ginsenosidimutans TaxID=687844 RepID=UPI000DABA5A5|nr:thiopeptide-type bacteriocin biosynthesis protein [Flavobacterium ginsenosidimutans]KAF2328048.1 hypothetical protein DM444_19825 [Flavobacterium ginsenosidimutans]